MRARSDGFTIVELLIVIVVIAILAAISIVAYTDIQVRAEKAKIVSAAKGFEKMLTLYKTVNGAYPSTTTVCLGSGYIDRNGDITPDCRWNSGNVNPSETFNTSLATVASASADMTQRPVMNGSAGVVGVYFMNDALATLDGEPQHNWIVYAVADKTCGLTVPLLSDTYPEFTSKGNDAVTENWGSGGLCWLPLP